MTVGAASAMRLPQGAEARKACVQRVRVAITVITDH
jgi:hypothetical protein